MGLLSGFVVQWLLFCFLDIPIYYLSRHSRRCTFPDVACPTAPTSVGCARAPGLRAIDGAKRPGAKLSSDAVGNLLVSVQRGGTRATRPVCITAHLDHPGFVADRMTKRDRLRAYWRGGVPPQYFVGTKVRFWVDGKWVGGRGVRFFAGARGGAKAGCWAGLV